MNILPYEFYNRDTVTVARELLGKMLVREYGGVRYSGKIVETEAYLPFEDPASHNFVGKNSRNAALFGDAGRLYVHSLRQYHCMDIVTEAVDVPGSVLIRAIEPIEGIEQMKLHRKAEAVVNLTSGPGKLCQAMQITRADNGKNVFELDSDITVLEGESVGVEDMVIATRVGISKAADLPLRFYINGSPFVSKLI